jgi:uncharacterized iron-regulated membrane protein
MPAIKSSLRKPLAWIHLWLGIIAGIFFCLMGVTGTIVTFRPQIASYISPRADSVAACKPAHWNRAQQEIEEASKSRINRIYFPAGDDPRYHFRMATDENAIYRHVIYDACSGRVLGAANLQWMDWVVDLHHNLLAGKTGRQYAGVIGIALLLSGAVGILIWLLSRPDLKRAFRLRRGVPLRATSFDLHRSVGLAASCLLLLQAFTGLWLCYSQTMRKGLSWFVAVPPDIRAPRFSRVKGQPPARLNDLIDAAQRAVPDGTIREIRMPEGNGNAQIRMWRPGDFRSLGNNVVSLDGGTAEVLALDLYSAQPGSKRFIQAMAGLHYGEWGGITFRTIYGLAGLATLPLFLTGFLYWCLGWRRAPAVVHRGTPDSAVPDRV